MLCKSNAISTAGSSHRRRWTSWHLSSRGLRQATGGLRRFPICCVLPNMHAVDAVQPHSLCHYVTLQRTQSSHWDSWPSDAPPPMGGGLQEVGGYKGGGTFYARNPGMWKRPKTRVWIVTVVSNFVLCARHSLCVSLLHGCDSPTLIILSGTVHCIGLPGGET